MDIFKKIIEFLFGIFSKKNQNSSNSNEAPTPPSPSESPSSDPVDLTPPPVEPPINTVLSITVEQLKQIILTLSDIKCNECLPHLLQTINEFEINTPLRIAAFIAQTAHESAGYSAFLENLNYSAQALLATWPSRFTPESAAIYARQPEKIANCVYSNRLGNGNEASGDGWRYRGRGVIQTTGRDNYNACGIGLGLDLIVSPELLEQPLNAFRSAGWYWKSRNCNAFADSGDFIELTKAINGGLNGLDDREAYYARAKSVFGIM